MHYRRSDTTLRETAEEIGVATVLSENFIEAGGKERFDVELLEASSGRVLWGNSYEISSSVEGLFQVQSYIAIQIAIAMNADLSPKEQQLLADRPTTSEAAYDHYIRGEVFILRARLPDGIESYEQATKEDPEFSTPFVTIRNLMRFWRK